MSKWLAVYDREDGWRLHSELPWKFEHDTSYRTGRKLRTGRHYQETWLSPVPERASAFIGAHQIIEAGTREEACRLVSALAKPKLEMLLQSE